MNVLNFVFIGLIFFSLAVIIFIFGKNIRRIKEISKQNPQAFSENIVSEKGFLRRLLGGVMKFFKEIFVCSAEWVIKYAKKLLHLVHFWLITIKREKKGDEDLDEMEAKKELLSEEQKNLNNLIHEGLGSEDDDIKANFVSQSLEAEMKTKDNPAPEIVHQKVRPTEEVVIMEPEIAEVKQELLADKENKVRKFFAGKKEAVFDGESFEEPEYESEEAGNIGEFEEFEQVEEPEEKKSFFGKIFSRFSRKTEKEVVDEYEQAFSEDEFSDGVVKVQSPEGNFSKNGGRIEGVVPPSGFPQDSDADDDLGVDRKILEKKIIQKIAKDPKNIENYRQLGELYIKMKNFKDAMDAYRYITQVSPRDADAKRKIEKIKLLKRIN